MFKHAGKVQNEEERERHTGQWVQANEDPITTNSFIASNAREAQGYEFCICALDKDNAHFVVNCPAETKAEVKGQKGEGKGSGGSGL